MRVRAVVDLARREVVIVGKRIKTVDVHARYIVPEAAQLINHQLEAPGLLLKGAPAWANTGESVPRRPKRGLTLEKPKGLVKC